MEEVAVREMPMEGGVVDQGAPAVAVGVEVGEEMAVAEKVGEEMAVAETVGEEMAVAEKVGVAR